MKSRRQEHGSGGPGGRVDMHGEPVFVDASGRRGRKFRRLGWLLIALCACCALMPLAVLVGGDSRAPWLPGLGRSDDEAGDRVVTRPGHGEAERGGSAGRASTEPGARPPLDLVGAALPLPPVPAGPRGSGAQARPSTPGSDPARPDPSAAAPHPPAGSPPVPADVGPERTQPPQPEPTPTEPAPGATDPGGGPPGSTAPPDPDATTPPATEPTGEASEPASPQSACPSPLDGLCAVLPGL